ncbi:hypothetical protein GIB67_026958 [Kingdonia uniflora]|uniref:Transport inhibitor response 1 domain-containing protein n=1 Tax=Kingdonia uniflora TaxID=39325 RepID=A0A7J7P1S1_9MAGN|nr:hypothetical protein GIB67_026958 [Kingdonia uniflora]
MKGKEGNFDLFIANCYFVSPERAIQRFGRLKSLPLKGKPRFADLNLVSPNSGAHFTPWVFAMSDGCPWLEKIYLTDEDLNVIAEWFPGFWRTVTNIKWSPVEFNTYPGRLSNRVHELPPVDLFVTTADPVLEPPIITVNTVLSLLALDYPANKLACYVSDDGGSPLTFYSLLESINFAKLWVPFCKKYNVKVRAPFQYFSDQEPLIFGGISSDFREEWKRLKDEYDKLQQKIEEATKHSHPYHLNGMFDDFSNIERGDNSSIVKILWEDKDNIPEGLPHLVYVSREKRPKHAHHYKAGAMNVLTRVSGVMTNAPFMLNVDCDMYANNPQVVLHAMCLLLESNHKGEEYAFVQYPQFFYGCLPGDPFGNHLIVIQEYLIRGVAGIQGPFYEGTGCFHRRKVIYGESPVQHKNTRSNINGKNKKLLRPSNISSSVKAAIQVADCSYESNTDWGTKVGWVYGSATEDVLTGLGIHKRGWRTAYLTPNPPAFLGCAPSGGPACLTQQKRAATGLLEILFSRNNPVIATITCDLRFRQCLMYLYLILWGARSIPELCYTLLAAYCLLTDSSFMPTVSENAFLVPASLFIIYNLYTLSEYLRCGLPVRAWWNNQRMARIISSTAWLFGVLSVVLKLLGLSETVFEITRKDQNNQDDGADIDPGRFTFDDSPIFVSGTALVLVHISALGWTLLRAVRNSGFVSRSGLGEIICSAWVVLSLVPFAKGLFRRGKYGIPYSTIFKSKILVGLFIYFCISVSRN